VTLLYPSRRHQPLAVSAFIDLMIDKLSAPDTMPEVLKAARG
jgi:hypothetical protein